MSEFRLHRQIFQWFDWVVVLTGSPEIAATVFAAIGGTIIWGAFRIGLWAYPRLWLKMVWPRLKKAVSKSMHWQVKMIFEWARWHGQRQASVWYMVLCAIAVSIAVTLWIKLPFLRPFLYVFVPLSLVTFGVLGWFERGERCTLPRFLRSFYVPTLGYSAAAAVSALGLPLVGF